MNNSILKYFRDLSDTQRFQFEMMGKLYPEWNLKINVISRKDIENLYVNHILHSLSIAKVITPIDGTTFLDMGTGGGFPGIPLATIFPNCQFHLIDRIGKKIKVATEIAIEIGLKNVTFQHGDIGECRNKYDYVVSRAVMRLDELLPLIRKNIAKENKNKYQNGLICLKGGNLDEELNMVNYPVIDFPITEFFNEPFFETKKIIYVPM